MSSENAHIYKPLKDLVSIVIPTYNPSKTLINILIKITNCLSSIPIIIVDDGSDNIRSQSILAEIKARYPNVTIYRLERNRGKPIALKSVLPMINTKYVLILDDDTLIEAAETDLRELIARMEKENADLAIFKLESLGTNNIVEQIQDIEYTITSWIKLSTELPAGSLGPGSLWRKSVLQNVLEHHDGQFEGDDLQMLMLYLKLSNKPKIIYVNDITIKTEPKHTFSELVKQRILIWIPGFYHVTFKYFKILIEKGKITSFYRISIYIIFITLLLYLSILTYILGNYNLLKHIYIFNLFLINLLIFEIILIILRKSSMQLKAALLTLNLLFLPNKYIQINSIQLFMFYKNIYLIIIYIFIIYFYLFLFFILLNIQKNYKVKIIIFFQLYMFLYINLFYILGLFYYLIKIKRSNVNAIIKTLNY